MPYVIAEPCIGSKDGSCIEVCPVDCIHPTPEEPDYDSTPMLYIDPVECIDCGVCAEACPVEAPYADSDLPAEWARYAEANLAYYAAPGQPG
jgi:NAD-dependent dihydropyrimidine dehydrogenase PreA subunit